MTDEELIKRLRMVTGFIRFETGDRIAASACLSEEAADRIEQLVATNEALVKVAVEAVEVLGTADDALTEAEAILGGEYGDSYGPLCETMLKLRRQIETLRAKLENRHDR
jgi:hypothetical protein